MTDRTPAAAQVLDLTAFRRARRALLVLRQLLHDLGVVGSIRIEAKPDGDRQLVVTLPVLTRELDICIPSEVNGVSVVTRSSRRASR